VTPSEVVMRKVTKFRPGEATNTSARSILLTDTNLLVAQHWYTSRCREDGARVDRLGR
jgi:hypothetical protein